MRRRLRRPHLAVVACGARSSRGACGSSRNGSGSTRGSSRDRGGDPTRASFSASASTGASASVTCACTGTWRASGRERAGANVHASAGARAIASARVIASARAGSEGDSHRTGLGGTRAACSRAIGLSVCAAVQSGASGTGSEDLIGGRAVAWGRVALRTCVQGALSRSSLVFGASRACKNSSSTGMLKLPLVSSQSGFPCDSPFLPDSATIGV